MTSDEYKKAFGLPVVPKTDIEKALNLALAIRKFEIDLYWKRATYFWAFLAVTLAGYFTLLAAKDVRATKKGRRFLSSRASALSSPSLGISSIGRASSGKRTGRSMWIYLKRQLLGRSTRQF